MNGDQASVVHVVDGDPAVRDSLSTLLGLNGFEVAAYATGSAFLEHMAATTAEPAPQRQWVICEADLPDGSGIELFSRLRARNSSAAFVLLVSSRSPNVVRSAQLAGIDRVFKKPLVYRNLLTYIGREGH